MTREKLTVGVLLGVLAFYVVVVGAKGIALIADCSLVGVLLGLALLVSAALAMGLSWREVQFGRRTAVLGNVLAAEGGIPDDELSRRPSGRVDRAAADALFEERKRETEAEPDSWRAWYRLALAYETAGDRTRARAAARHALTLYP